MRNKLRILHQKRIISVFLIKRVHFKTLPPIKSTKFHYKILLKVKTDTQMSLKKTETLLKIHF